MKSTEMKFNSRKFRIKTKKCLMFLLVIMLLSSSISFAQENVDKSLSITKGEIGAVDFATAHNVSGRGVTVAVIDTGVDIGHPDLQQTLQGEAKIIDWVDFTDEGLVITQNRGVAQDGKLTTSRGSVQIGSIKSKSGILHYGYFRENTLDERGFIAQDINRDGDNQDSFLVMLVDSRVSGFYDTVWVDTDGDNSLTDEKPMKTYSKNKDYAFFGKDVIEPINSHHSSFVVCEIDSAGGFVKLGFDGNGHGTHVSGIIGGNGRIKGIAPGVKIMALKALKSSGDGSWDNIAKAMNYAAANGADIISISIGTTFEGKDGANSHIQLINQLSSRYNTLFVIAAGNSGPGLGSVTVYGDVSKAVVVGAYISPEIWKLNYNYEMVSEGLCYFSGMGPRKDGGLAPDVVAPGSVVSSVNVWDSGGYYLLDGTSMAVPHVVGAAALLMEKAAQAGISYTPGKIKKALELSAQPIKGFHYFEQGWGLINIPRAWEYLQNIKQIPNITVKAYTPGVTTARGIYLRGEDPGSITVSMLNTGDTDVVLNLSSSAQWIKPEKQRIMLPKGKERKLLIKFDPPKGQGIHFGFLYGDTTAGPGKEITLPVTIVKPYRFTAENDFRLAANSRCEVGRWKRFFFKVDSAVNELDFNLAVEKTTDGILEGRARMHIINPQGKEIFISEYAGLDYIESMEEVEARVKNPMQGIWEVVVYSDPVLTEFDMYESKINLTASIKGLVWEKPRLFLSFGKNEPVSGVSETIAIKNQYKDFTGKVLGLGLVEENDGKVEKVFEILDEDIKTGPVFEISNRAFLVKLSIKDMNYTKSDLDLYLYHFNPENEEWEQVGTSSTYNESEEAIEILYPEPGKYMAYIDGYNIPSGSTMVKYVHQVFEDNGSITVLDDFKHHKLGETWEVPVHITVPKNKGSYTGYLMVSDDTNNIISTIPVNVKVQQKELSLSANLKEQDKRVILKIFDSTTLEGVGDLPVKINGKVYFTRRDGIISFPLEDYHRNTLEIIVDRGSYSLYKMLVILND